MASRAASLTPAVVARRTLIASILALSLLALALALWKMRLAIFLFFGGDRDRVGNAAGRRRPPSTRRAARSRDRHPLPRAARRRRRAALVRRSARSLSGPERHRRASGDAVADPRAGAPFARSQARLPDRPRAAAQQPPHGVRASRFGGRADPQGGRGGRRSLLPVRERRLLDLRAGACGEGRALPAAAAQAAEGERDLEADRPQARRLRARPVDPDARSSGRFSR